MANGCAVEHLQGGGPTGPQLEGFFCSQEHHCVEAVLPLSSERRDIVVWTPTVALAVSKHGPELSGCDPHFGCAHIFMVIVLVPHLVEVLQAFGTVLGFYCPNSSDPPLEPGPLELFVDPHSKGDVFFLGWAIGPED